MEERAQSLFSVEDRVAPLGIIALEGAEELGEKIDAHLVRWARTAGMDVDSFRLKCSCPRFGSGDAKGIIEETVRGYDLYIVVDVGNYSPTYPYFGMENHMSPDDHFQNLKRIIQAASGKAHRLNVIMPVLYGGRQHRRNYRESLDCAFALQELQRMGVENVVTFDAHDPRVQNAVPLMGFDNLRPSYQVLKKMLKSFPDMVIDRDEFMVISPDEGALDRNMFYASVMGVEMGMFYKRRDYSRVVDGRNPIVAHEYLGSDVKGKDVFVADDIISSGESMLDIAYNVKKRGAKRFFCFATFAIFAKGLETFDKAYQAGVLDGVFGTNLTYRTEELKNRPWFYEVDVSKYISYYVSALNHDISTSQLIDPHAKMVALLEKRREEYKKSQHEQLKFQ
ncbi:ribose-phosphate pyrophosphokinase [Acutalibacter muris]|uniref:ribose-phosphate diphosphokinase n=1 Tax=Acutalibacter muris TaxID=1796620 RepID=A0A1Z2XUC3_9FIRM|nr:ribose-phosphate pyrophosphokinase [Acutalibacter muris]ANU54711.1 phosphoribosylpyrophosphate synthetase [Hungateiclostridiaceae bacterium KB18]ASB42058.1 phosphoribosylpyrophosphate synthetase [Acutalibacter muris]MCI9543795.1 ribose-phosphate pyrophosphokinase [Acutalibacter muris]QQR31327.1 ribose-phosphate pyrophosphokinase [Acutalibacter muris]